MGKYTWWQHFKNNVMWTTLFVFTLFVVSLISSIYRDDVWQFSFFFLGIAITLVIYNYFDWKKKTK